MEHSVAWKVAEALVDHLRPKCTRIEIKGSLARLKPYPGDIEIIAAPDLTPVPRARPEFGQPIPRSYDTMLDKLVDEMRKDGAIRLIVDGKRQKKFWLNYAGIKVDLFINIPPSHWGVQAVIRTGPSDFSQWCVTNRNIGGALPNDCFVKHQVVWLREYVAKEDIPDDADDALPLLTPLNHVALPEEIDFLDFLELGWIEPKDRVARWK